ncbi:hypothetical protein IWX46DRAFT_378826 [Phyllosticta citricarpa]|uniref:Uncharacterized protein n=1 Tax=Phyllosticta citricarpa TaxID=55181 RepID=A0ABR1L759_9PEZI
MRWSKEVRGRSLGAERARSSGRGNGTRRRGRCTHPEWRRRERARPEQRKTIKWHRIGPWARQVAAETRRGEKRGVQQTLAACSHASTTTSRRLASLSCALSLRAHWVLYFIQISQSTPGGSAGSAVLIKHAAQMQIPPRPALLCSALLCCCSPARA